MEERVHLLENNLNETQKPSPGVQERSKTLEVKSDTDIGSEVKDRITKMHLNFDVLNKKLSQLPHEASF